MWRAHVALPEGLNPGVVWVGVVVLRVLIGGAAAAAAARLVLLVSQLGVSRLDPARQKGQRSDQQNQTNLS